MMTGTKNIIVFLLVVSMALVGISCRGKGKPDDKSQAGETEIYTCPMHPEIRQNAPGSCPICGMDLVKVETGAGTIGDDQLEALIRPANAFVISDVQVTSIEHREEDIELRVVGTVAYDTRQVGVISSRVAGRIERLYVRYRYQEVGKGQRIMDIYSPELMTAQQNLLFLLRNDPENISLLHAAREKLVLMGMSSGQVEALIRTKTPVYSVPVFSKYRGFVTDISTPGETASADKMQQAMPTGNELTIREGMYVQSGQAVFTVYDQSKAWILLEIYPDQQALVKVGDPVRIVPETSPSGDFRATIDYIEPIFRAGSKTVRARVYFDNGTKKLPIGSWVTANIFSKSREAWWLPKEAVLSLGRDRIVFKKDQSGFSALRIITGTEVNNYVQVISGLQKQDSVAVNAQFLVDNEAFIKITGNE